MRSLDYLFGNVRWGINFNSREVKETLRKYVDLDLSVEEILDLVMPVVNLSQTSDLNHIRHCLSQVIIAYQSDYHVSRDATEILKSLNDSIQMIKRDISNTLYFGLDKADYSKMEISALNEFQKAVNNFCNQINLKNKFECDYSGGCENCLSYGRKGCKVQNNETRARQWGLMI